MTNEYRHIPVLLSECIEALHLSEGQTYVDATLGGAGHSLEVAKHIGRTGHLIGIDQDAVARKAARERLEALPEAIRPEIDVVEGNFGDLDALLVAAQIPSIDAILFDLGVSSVQIDTPARGFSFKETPLTTSEELVEVIKAAVPASARRAGGHPAKRTFQALRIEVNGELDVLRSGLEAAIRWLAPGGHIAVISYHSLEDRIVKDLFKKMSTGCTCPPDLPICVCGNKPVLKVLTRKPILPSPDEIKRNPRSRSAKLRVAQRLDENI